MKKFRKAIVALLAMVMVLGCFAVTASADEDTVLVKVVWDGAGTDDMSLYGWDGADTLGGWPGKQMEAKGNGVYILEFAPSDKTNMSLIPNKEGAQTVDLTGIDGSSGYVTITIGAEDAGKYTATVDNTTKIDVNAGVSAPVVAAAIAVVSMVGIVVFTKRRTVAE